MRRSQLRVSYLLSVPSPDSSFAFRAPTLLRSRHGSVGGSYYLVYLAACTLVHGSTSIRRELKTVPQHFIPAGRKLCSVTRDSEAPSPRAACVMIMLLA